MPPSNGSMKVALKKAEGEWSQKDRDRLNGAGFNLHNFPVSEKVIYVVGLPEKTDLVQALGFDGFTVERTLV